MKTRFSVKDTAKLLGVTEQTIYNEIGKKKLGCAKVGNRIIITFYDLENYIGKERLKSLIEGILD